MTKPENVKPCATCPFRAANLGQPNPEGWDEQPERHDTDRLDWYSLKNLRRVWDGARKEGGTLQCHCTVDDHAEYVGKTAKPGRVALCAGALWAVYRHVRVYDRLVHAVHERGLKLTPAATMKLYRGRAGKYPLTRDGMIQNVVNLTLPPLLGGLPQHLVPASFHESTSQVVRVPWDDPLINEPDGVTRAIADLTTSLPSP